MKNGRRREDAGGESRLHQLHRARAVQIGIVLILYRREMQIYARAVHVGGDNEYLSKALRFYRCARFFRLRARVLYGTLGTVQNLYSGVLLVQGITLRYHTHVRHAGCMM